MLTGHLLGFMKKIVGGNTFMLIEKGQKGPRVGAWESMG